MNKVAAPLAGRNMVYVFRVNGIASKPADTEAESAAFRSQQTTSLGATCSPTGLKTFASGQPSKTTAANSIDIAALKYLISKTAANDTGGCFVIFTVWTALLSIRFPKAVYSTLDLEELLPREEVAVFDMKDHLFMGLILKEKDFREETMKGLDLAPPIPANTLPSPVQPTR